MSPDLERRIAAYREELLAASDLAAADLDEIEDHLRALVGELRDFDAAVARLGSAREVAREHARVRGTFGARLSRARSWAAAAMFAPMLGYGVVEMLRGRATMSLLGIVAVGIAMVAGLVTRRTWVRAMLLGVCAINLLYYARAMRDGVPVASIAPFIAGFVVIAGLVAPWRRGELTRAGWAVAAVGFSYAGAVIAFDLSRAGFVRPAAGLIVGLAVMIGFVGVVLRARSASIVLAIGALAAAQLVVDSAYPLQLGCTAVGMAAAAVLSWRDARHGLGTLRGFAA